MLDLDFILCSLWSLLALSSICFGIRIPNKDGSESNFMTREYTDTLRWIACFVILLSHVPVPATYNLLGSFHFVAVTLFFLLSGYGLCNSMLIDKEAFTRKQPRRFLKLVALFLLGWGVKIPFRSVVSSGGLLFIPLLLILYIVFGYLTAIYSEKRKYLFIVVVILMFVIGYPIASVLWLQKINQIFGWGSSEIGFGIGILLALYKDKVTAFLYKHTIVICLAGILVFLISGVSYIRFRNMDNYYLSLSEAGMRMSISGSLIIIVFALSTRLIIGNWLTYFLGEASVFIYIFQGVSLEITYIFMRNVYSPGFETLMVIVIDLAISTIATHIVNKMIGISAQG